MKTSTPKNDIQLPFSNSHAFIIGINDYEQVSRLTTAVNDANALAELLEKEHTYKIHGPLLNPKKAELLKLLQEELPRIVGREDRVLFYFAGHGIALDSDDRPRGYLVPVDAKAGDIDTLVSMDELHEAILKLPCQHGMLIMDCCFAGAFKWSTGFRDVVFDLPGVIYEERFYQYAQDPAWQVITSSASDQKAVDILADRSLGLRADSGAMHSPFAQALLEGLAGAADTVPKNGGDGVITATELYTYLRDRVEDETIVQGKRQSPSMFSLQKHDKGQYIFTVPNHRLNLPPIPKRNPYMGLKSYNETDTSLFYGRDRVIKALHKLIQTNSLVVVSGASGTGKSSVIKAGLLPLLRKNKWEILPVIRPGKEPMQNLNMELTNINSKVEKGQPSLLIIDQYEELITQCLHPEERNVFEEQLAKWLQSYPNLHIIISIRSDFEPQFEKASLAKWWSKGRYVVPIFSPDELREVIIKPTVQEVLFFEPESLVDKLVDEVNQAPGALPLLSFTLSELYHAYLKSGRTNRAFIEEDYKKMGGVIGALRTRADTIYDELDAVHQNSMRKLMVRMVSAEGGDLASRRVLANDLIFRDTRETKRVAHVAQKLVDARLISSGRDKQGHRYFEPAHDALVRAWNRLWEWIRTIGEGELDLLFKLNLAVADFTANSQTDQAKEYLWNEDPRLDQLYSKLQVGDHYLNTHEEVFLRESMKVRKSKSKRLKIIIGTVIVVLLAISGIAVFQGTLAKKEAIRADQKAVEAEAQRDSAIAAELKAEIAKDSAKVAKKRAEDERDRANQENTIARASALSAKAREVNIKNPTKALNLAVAAYRLHPGKENASAIHDILSHESGNFYQNLIVPPKGTGNKIVFSPPCPDGMDCPLGDSKTVITKSANTLSLWNINGRLIKSIKLSIGIKNAVFSPDSKRILINDGVGGAYLLNIKDEKLKPVPIDLNSDYKIVDLDFTPNGKRIAIAKGDKILFYTINQLNVVSDSISLNHTSSYTGFKDFSFLPDGKKMLLVYKDKTVLVDVDSNKVVATLEENNDFVTRTAFSLDGEKILTGTNNGLVILWDLNDRGVSRVKTFSNNNKTSVQTIAFTSDEKRILVGDDRGVSVWNLKGRLLETYRELEVGGIRSTISPDGKRIITKDYSDVFKVWNVDGKIFKFISGHKKKVYNVKFSKDGQKILSCSRRTGTVILWSLDGKKLHTFAEPGKRLFDADFLPGQNSIITVNSDGILKIWNLDGQLLKTLPNNFSSAISVLSSPDPKNRLLLIEERNQAAKLTNLDGKVLMEIPKVKSMNFAPDGQSFITSDKDKTATLWNSNGEKLSVFEDVRNIESLAFSQVCRNNEGCFFGEEQIIVTGSNGYIAKLWSLDGRELLTIPHKDFTGYRKVAFFPKGDMILTNGFFAKIYNIEGEGLQTLMNYRTGSIADFSVISPDGKYILTESGRGTMILWYNFFWEWENGKLWDRVYKLSPEEQAFYGIDWEY